jgi:phosphoglycerate-specific signal transduction histidine kinase
MDNKKLLLASLYEISMSIGTSLDLDKLLKSAISKYIEKFNCIGAVVVEEKKKNIVFAKPKILKFDKYIEYINSNINMFKHNKDNIFEIDNIFYYIAKLDGFGYFILLRKTNKFELENIKALESLNEKLSNAIISSVNSSKLIDNERMMLHQSKLASMGEMIGNIAHQWRQPLASMSASLQNIELAYEVGALDKEFLYNQVESAKKTAEHMSKTIDDFMKFYKPNKEKFFLRLDYLLIMLLIY